MILADMESEMPWKELGKKYGLGNPLYDTLHDFEPRMAAKYNDLVRKQNEANEKVEVAEERLRKLEAKIAEAEGKLGEAESSLRELNEAKATTEQDINGLETKITALNADMTSAKERTRIAIEEDATTETQLAQFVATRNGLAKYSLTLDDLGAIDSVFTSISKLDKDPQRIIETYKRVSDLYEEERRLRDAIDSHNLEVTEREETLRKLNANIADKRSLVDKVLYIESLGATSREVGGVIEAALKSAAKNGYTTEESLTALAADLGKNYGVTRSLREEVDVLAKKRLNLEQVIAELEKQRTNTQQILDARQRFMNSHIWLNSQGVTDQEIVELHEVIAEYENDVTSFKRTLKELGGLNVYLVEKRTVVEGLEARDRQLNKSLKEKEAKLTELDTLFLKKGDDYSEKLKKYLSTLESATKGIDTQLNKLFEGYYSSIDVKVAGFLGEIAKVLKDATGVRDYVHEVFADASNLRNTEALAAMMSGLNVNPRLLYIQLIALIIGAREFFVKTGDNKLATILERALVEMRNIGGPIDL